MSLAFLDDLLDDEESLVAALGVLTSATSSDIEKLFKALVVLLTAEIKDRIAALPPPPAPEPLPADPNTTTGLASVKAN